MVRPVAWTKESALEEARDLIKTAESLAGSHRRSPDFIEWMIRSGEFIHDVLGPSSSEKFTFNRIPWGPHGSFITDAFNFERAMAQHEHRAFIEGLSVAVGVLQSCQRKIEKSEDLDDVYAGPDESDEGSEILRLLSIAEHKLRKTVKDQPEDEAEVQDRLEALLIGADLDYNREKDRVQIATKATQPDFTLPTSSTAVEVKFCNSKTREKAIIDEMNADIRAYKRRYKNVVFVVYDVGVIQHVDTFRKSFEDEEGVHVIVVKH